ncbi:MAG: hypothetical protein ACI4J0_12715 [Huintestinicola sp.]|uniref:hypothetical protein n=1 Tax=Huintestinicola sp. TaxID=2981661 RepID=UPI003F0D4E63
MKKRPIAAGMCALLMLAGCGEALPDSTGHPSEEAEEISAVLKTDRELKAAADSLAPSSILNFGDGLEITGLGVTFDGRPTSFDGCYYFPAIEKMTGVRVSIDWQTAEDYSTTVAATLLSGRSELPDILNPMDFGVMELAGDELILPLDDYLELMPDIAEAVGEEHMDAWRSADGHIYTIPSVSTIRGSFSVMIRQDWLNELGMDVPDTWEDWLAYWRGVRDNDLNGNGDPSDEIPVAFAGGMGGERSLTQLMNAFGIAASNDSQFCVLEDGTCTMVYEHPRYPEFLSAMAGLYAEGILRDGYGDYTYSSIEEMMGNNTLGSTMTFAASGAQTAALRESGDEDALWISTAPVIGPYGDRMIPERELITPMWCITAGAEERGRVEDIVRFFNWCFTEEGAYLYNYGIEGVSYTVENGVPVLDKELVANGFDDYRAVGMNFEPFGGLWLRDAYMQCLFAGKDESDLTDIRKETYKGLFDINNEYFYVQPVTIETPAYVKYRTTLITDGVCKYRDMAVRGEISAEEFRAAYESLKEEGLSEVAEECSAYYRSLSSGGGKE